MTDLLEKLKGLIIQKHDMEEDKKATVADFNTRIKELDSEMYGLAKQIDKKDGDLFEDKEATDADYQVVDEDHQLEEPAPQIEGPDTSLETETEEEALTCHECGAAMVNAGDRWVCQAPECKAELFRD